MRDLKDHPKGHTAFIADDDTVINLAGENYYRACGTPVREFTSCVKRVNHTGSCEDFYGVTKAE